VNFRNGVIALVPTLLLSACLCACGSQPQRRSETPQAAPAPAASRAATSAAEIKRYELKGRVVSIDKSAKRMTVDHEAIPGFMGAMAMPYPVKDEHALDEVSAGDQITAKVVSSGGSFWLEDIVVTSHGKESQ
jgi:protein SCO1/2